MFDTTPEFTNVGTAEPNQADDLRWFAERYRDGLLNAAGLLGGPHGIRTAQSVLEGLAQPGHLARSTVKALDDLLDLLMLEHVHESNRIEAALFAAIDPASPIVEEICLIADQLHEALKAYKESEIETESTVRRRAAA